jgi:hypothetical protein
MEDEGQVCSCALSFDSWLASSFTTTSSTIRPKRFPPSIVAEVSENGGMAPNCMGMPKATFTL